MHPYRVSLIVFALSMAAFFVAVDVIIHSSRMPGPQLSDSVSFNQKALWLRKALHHDPAPEILIVGSSMGINNVNGEELARDLKTEAILNASSWGLEPAESTRIAQVMINHLNPSPKIILMPVCIGDFKKHGPKEIDWLSFERCLFSPFLLPLYLKYPDYNYYFTTIREQNVPAAINHTTYDSLHYDAFGGVPLSCTNFLYTTQRWDNYQKETLDPAAWDPNAIPLLTASALFFRVKKVHFVVVACPMRPAAEQALGSRADTDLWSKVQAALAPVGGTFIHVASPEYTDADFVDGYHLNECGSRKLARQLAPQLKPWLKSE